MLRWVLMLMVLVSVSACNTLRGMGQDVQDAGQSMQKAADK